MKTEDHIAALEREGIVLAEAASRAGLAATVPSCQPWRVRDLLRHISYIHSWAATHVREAPSRIINGPPEAELLGGGPLDGELLDSYRAGHRMLTGTLRSADPALVYATFLPAPSPLAFWARRQAHETAIHRADAELAAGAVTPFDPGFAADGIGELVTGFAPRLLAGHPGAGKTLALRATDTGDEWQVAFGRSGRGERASAVLSGPASQLYLLLWNRQGPDSQGVTLSGDPGLLQLWRDAVRVRWE